MANLGGRGGFSQVSKVCLLCNYGVLGRGWRLRQSGWVGAPSGVYMWIFGPRISHPRPPGAEQNRAEQSMEVFGVVATNKSTGAQATMSTESTYLPGVT